MTDLLKAELGVQAYTVRLIGIDCCNDCVIANRARTLDEVLEQE
jgi:hypothetical protein